ncbi:MAG: hypothetical protein JEY91_19815, partial [Spirochaetaceae bacterium]|nr:hypothetical protein [Spirochaetaceae bacterium]
LTITFATPVNDDQVRSGYIVVYDSTADYIGSSNWFVDNSGAIDANFTGGFNTDGSNNIYIINLSTELSSAITTNGTYYVSVFLVDGKQYGDGRYDCISYSAPKSFIID